MDTQHRRNRPASSFLMVAFALVGFVAIESAHAQAPAIDSISPNEVVVDPVPQPQLVITGSNFVVGLPSQTNRPTVTITHTDLPKVSFSTLANVNFSGTQATIPAGINSFNMLQMPEGAYDLTLSRPDGELTTVPAGFALVPQPEPEPGQIEMRIASYWGGPILGMDLSEDGTLAYIANGRMLRILDLTDESNPTELGSIYLTGVNDVKVRDGYAFVAANSPHRFCVVDVSDPIAPELVWVQSSGTTQSQVILHGDYAYVRGISSTQVFDISDPLNVVAVGTVSGASGILAIHQDLLLVGGQSGSVLKIFDLARNPINPPLVGELSDVPGFPTHVRSMTAEGDHLYLTSQPNGNSDNSLLVTIDISTPANPAVSDVTEGFSRFDSTHRLAAASGLLYVAEHGGDVGDVGQGLWIFDIGADPSRPALITTYKRHPHLRRTTEAALLATNDRVYLWDAPEGFEILDVSDPANPQRVGKFHSPSTLGTMAKSPGSDLLYIADLWSGFTVLDVSKPEVPRVVSHYVDQPYTDNPFDPNPTSGNWVRGIAVENDRVYLTAHRLGMEVIDVSDPENPTFLNAFRVDQTQTPCPDSVCTDFDGIVVRNGLAHVGLWYSSCWFACGGHALLTIDVSNVWNMSQLNFTNWGPGESRPARIALDNRDIAYTSGEGSSLSLALEHYVGGISSPSAVELASSAPQYSTGVAWHDNTLYVTRRGTQWNGLWIRDVTDPSNPELLAHVDPATSYDAIGVQSDRAYAVAGSNLHMLDVSSPSEPANVQTLSGVGGPNTSAILVDEPHVFVTAIGQGSGISKAGLSIIDIHGVEPVILGDLNSDQIVDEQDRAMFCAALGSSTAEPGYLADADLNDDGTINHFDQAMFNDILPPCAGDVASSDTFQPPADGVADGADLAFLLGAWGGQPSCADFVASRTFTPPPDGTVDGADLAYLLGAWGRCN